VKNYTFNFEVQTLLEQFVAAFNDIIIKRYDNTKTVVPSSSGIKVDFVYAPKQRVYDTLNTPAPGGLTVPVVAVNIKSISRDSKRVFNKLEGFTVNNNYYSDTSLLKKIPQPVPVNIGVSMTIVTKFQSDMDQIISNFVPYCDPYIIISWKLPFANNVEIRSEVLWSGELSLTYPTDLAANQPYRLTAETNFTIKGWLFKKTDDVVKKIYTINESFFASDNPQGDYILLREL
jgi:T4-like virus Myoviridae tail sheath stabiliser